MRDDLRHNYIFNLMDAAFFGLAIGFASFSTIIPLFINHLTSSQTLIGLVPAIHNVSWMAPQLFTAGWVSRQKRYKPLVLLMTIHERLPFLGMALVAYLYARLGVPLALALTFALLTWQGLGAGVTANFWQSYIAKIFPPNMRGTFIGVQAAAANLTLAAGAVLSGLLLDRIAFPSNFVVCFVIAGLCLALSWLALERSREADHTPIHEEKAQASLWQNMGAIWKRDGNFRLFILARSLAMVASMGFAFYIIYAVRHFGVSQSLAGILTAVLSTSAILGNATMGWLGDRIGNRTIMLSGAACAVISTLIALLAPSMEFLFAAMILAGITNVAIWTIGMTMSMQFGSDEDRPMYIGMANSLTAPASILAPVMGGWMADIAGYSLTFSVAIAAGILMFISFLLIKEPHHSPQAVRLRAVAEEISSKADPAINP